MNWHKRIDAAEKRGRFTEDDKHRADNWVTCACGEQDKRIPRFMGEPTDEGLQHLGYQFSGAIGATDFGKARTTLARIERRAAKVLAGLEEK